MLVSAECPNLSKTDQIRSRPCPSCYICGTAGSPLYRSLKDRYWGAYGLWNLSKCRNRLCGLVWLDPIPIREDIAKAYQNYYTHWEPAAEGTKVGLVRRLIRDTKANYLAYAFGYGKRGLKSYLGLVTCLAPLRRSSIEFEVMYLPFLPGGRLLEVGCGNGTMLKGMADLGWHVEGIDFDPAAVETCRRRGLEVHVGLLEDRCYPANSYDAVTMSHLIEHVYEPL